VFRKFPYELKRVASQSIAASDSVHRNISEGYCRRSIYEYLKFLYIALSSLGESVSGLNACRQANQITEDEFEMLDTLAYKLENGLLRLVESLEQKRDKGEWTDHLMVKESNLVYAS
jgi:four helix bundle protein